MSILFSLKNTICTRQYSKCLNLKSLHRKHLLPSLTKDFSNQPSLGIKEKTTKRIIPFQEAVETRRNEANCSIIVQVQSAQSYKELHTYCSGIGTVKNMLHYTTGTEPLHFIIVEFGKEVDIKNIFSTCSYIEDMQVVPVHSPFLWFKASTKKLAKLKPAKNIKLNVENGTKLLTNEEIIQALANSEGVSGQMINLHKLTKLNDIGTRLRFLAAKQIEMAICGMFPGASAIPFGSSVNGYGKMGCDLDLVLRLKSSKELTEEARLVYHCKASMGSERSISQRHMESIGDLIQLFLPGCSQVRRILQARVPIIKYYQQLADVECDLSMTNMSGFYMSDLLYIMGSIDWRVRPLIFTIRRWAAAVGITNSSPGRWISNFSLTLLVIAFLQSNATSSQILPSMNTLINMAGTDDKYITEDGINCTFLRDINKYLLVNPIENEEDLKCLLLKFFEYYSNFDFTSKAISLNDAVPITKPEHSALYIVNPLQRGLNVSKNVSSEELDKFRMELRNAAWLLESENEKSSNWGVLNLLLPKKKLNSNDSRYSSGKGKLIEVSKLFDEDDENDDHVFKNVEVKKQVEGIKKETKQQLKKIESNHLNLNRQNSGR